MLVNSTNYNSDATSYSYLLLMSAGYQDRQTRKSRLRENRDRLAKLLRRPGPLKALKRGESHS